MKTAYIFLILHCIADYPLQGDFLSQMKGKNDFLLFCHSAIWSGIIWAGFVAIGKTSSIIFPFLLVGHFCIDRWKSHKADKSKSLTYYLYIDQLLHFFQIVICFIF